MPRQFRIEYGDGGTDTMTHVKSEVEWSFGDQDLATLTTNRADVDALSDAPEEREDEVYLVRSDGTEWGGLLKDVVRKGSQVELVVDGFERYARYAEPVAGDDIYENAADDTIINDALGAVPQLSAGTVSNVDSGLSFVFAHASPARKMRRVEESTAGELRYNTDKTVDYVAERGTDRSATVTLTPSNSNVIGDMEVARIGGGEKVTHLRMLGAGEGPAQVQTEVVASSYSGGDEFWDTYRDKGLTSEDALANLGQTIIDERNSEYVEVEATLKGLANAPELGDTYEVSKPEDGLPPTDLRVVELTEVIDKDGRRFGAVLSNRQKSRTDAETKRRQDVENYNVAFEGSPVTMTAGGGRQPVDSTHDYEFDFYYPDEVEYEHRVKLFVKGLQYRAYSQGAGAGGDHSHTVEVTHPSHAHAYNASNELQHAHTITSAEFSHRHSLSVGSANAENHGHGDGTYGAALHPHLDGTLAAVLHGHGDGTLAAALHGHSDGTLDAALHGHGAGSFDADLHDHTDGNYGADSHGHTDGTYDADNHDHPQNITETSEANTPHGAVTADGQQVSSPGDTFGGWDTLATINKSDPYEMGFVNVHATSAEATVEVRARDSSTTSINDSFGDFTPREQGAPLIGQTESSGRTASVCLAIPDDWGFIDVDYKTAGDPNCNFIVTYMLLGEHTHDVTIGSPTDFTQPGVSGSSGNNAPDVDGSSGSTGPPVSGNSGDTGPDVAGNTGDTGPGVGGNTDDTSPDVGGETDSTAPDVGGSSANTQPGVQGDTDSQGGVRTSDTQLGAQETSETALGTTQSESSDASGDHTHPVDPGIIDQAGEYPSNADVVVNGTPVGVSLGGGAGTFEQEVDLAGMLNPGQVNTVRVTSDTLGHIQAHLDIDVYRQILGNG